MIAPPIQPLPVDTLSRPSLQLLSTSHDSFTAALPAARQTTTSSQSLPVNSAQTRLHTLLKSYSAHDAVTKATKPSPKSPVRTHRVKIKPPVPTFKKTSFPRERSGERKIRTSLSKGGKQRVPPSRQSSSRQVEKERSYYTSSTASMGPHPWGQCPRRSSSRSLPSSPAGKQRSILVTSPSKSPAGASFTSPVKNELRQPEVPFRVGTPDAGLMGRRDFCGELIPSPSSAVSHSSSNTRQRTRSATPCQRSPRSSSNLSTKPKSPGGARKKLSWETAVPGSCPSRLNASRRTGLLVGSDSALVRKYLTRPGTSGVGLGTSPSQIIGEKVDELIRECSEHTVSWFFYFLCVCCESVT